MYNFKCDCSANDCEMYRKENERTQNWHSKMHWEQDSSWMQCKAPS